MIAPGALARRALGPLFPIAGRAYRRLFVDLDAVARVIPPTDGLILDVGGGDGQQLAALLRLNPRARAVLIDIAPHVGSFLSPSERSRVELLPATPLRDYPGPRPDLVLLSDVVHHVPPTERQALLADLRALMGDAAFTLVVKDVEPGSLKARLTWLADRYISGDREVALIGRRSLCALVATTWPELVCYETPLFRRAPPNYCLVFRPPAEQVTPATGP
jgi:hypothetical protein